MKIYPSIYLLWVGLLPAWSAEPTATVYHGLCEASAAVFIDDTRFVVASDETNVVRIYTRSDTSLGIDTDFRSFTGFDKSDIEAVARVGNQVFWISSHSLTGAGEDKRKRKVFFATNIMHQNDSVTLEPTGAVVSLRKPLLAAAGVSKADLNIEGLAATPSGELLVGLRNTLDGKALVVPFKNPVAVLDGASTPEFGSPFALDLGGNGIRSLELVEASYLIIAGPVSDTGNFALYSWAGPGADPIPVDNVRFDGLRPEAMMTVPGTANVQILSDDGSDQCSDEMTPIAQRAFRSIDLVP